jgi:hypothetical protein
LDELAKATGIKTFYEAIEAASLRVEFEPPPDAPAKFESLVYWFYVEVGKHVFYALIERPIVEDVMIGQQRRRVTTGKAQWLEAYVLENATDEERKTMISDYEREMTKKPVAPRLCLGNLREFIENSNR